MHKPFPIAALGVILIVSAWSAEVRASTAATPTEVLTGDFVAAWQKGDAPGLANLWTEDGDWMSVVGSRQVQSGQIAIQRVWEVGLEGRDTPEKRRLEILIDSVREFGEDLTQIDAVMVFGSPETGEMREALTAMLVRVEGGWLIASARVARIGNAQR